MTVVRYGQDKVLNRDNGNLVKTYTWKPLFKKMKTLHWNLTSSCIKWRFSDVLSPVWKRLQTVWRKYHVLNNKTFQQYVWFFANQALTLPNFTFPIKLFFYMNKKSTQKYLVNEKSFLRWNKNHFYQFWMAIIEANNKIFFGRRESHFKDTEYQLQNCITLINFNSLQSTETSWVLALSQ